MILAPLQDVPPPLWSDAWWSEFTRSPALAGIAAVIAAGLAFWGVRYRAGVDKEQAKTARADQVTDRAADRWWEMYQWFLNRVDDIDPGRAVGLMRVLEDSAPGSVEAMFAAVASGTLADKDQAGAVADEDQEGSGDEPRG